MPPSFLLGRVLLQFREDAASVIGQLSAAVRTPEGSLWVCSDELATIERLTLVEPFVYGEQTSFAIADFLPLYDPRGEVDVEGMAFSGDYLWLTGSHSQRRKKPKGKKRKRDLTRLAEVDPQPNRYLLGRIPVLRGQLFKCVSRPDDPERVLTAGTLHQSETGNALVEALRRDEHLGPILSFALPTKENGFDVEGLAARDERVFLGLRGPVLGEWAVLLEAELHAGAEPGDALDLRPLGDHDRPYRKHFLDLDGLGIRELSFAGDDLLVLAGPTMQLEGAMKVYRLRDALSLTKDTIHDADSGDLELLFDLPFTIGSDHAEGLTNYPVFGREAVLAVYDSPDPARLVGKSAVFADLLALPGPE